MAIKIALSDKTKITIKGTIKDEAGLDQPFDFKLICKREPTEAFDNRLREVSQSEDKTTDAFANIFADLIEDWSGVKDEFDKPLPYSPEALAQLFAIPGMVVLFLTGYRTETGAKAKN